MELREKGTLFGLSNSSSKEEKGAVNHKWKHDPVQFILFKDEQISCKIGSEHLDSSNAYWESLVVFWVKAIRDFCDAGFPWRSGFGNMLSRKRIESVMPLLAMVMIL
ncbi:hypothetical protein CFP56_040792 [Quercus suber]|uniref:Uncharacterized protein n=1 Tax=Quercus suber TaxID=58331 RepID=A0AAW0LLB4_QUESU